jgi:hypothetical protein
VRTVRPNWRLAQSSAPNAAQRPKPKRSRLPIVSRLCVYEGVEVGLAAFPICRNMEEPTSSAIKALLLERKNSFCEP